MTRSAIIILAVFMLSSCHCVIRYSRLNPPEIRNPGVERNITLLSFYDTTKIDFNQKKKQRVYKDAYREFVYSLKKAADSTHDYSLNIIEKYYFKDDSLRTRFSLEELFDELDPELLLIILSFDLDRPYSSEKIEDDQGNKTKIATYYLETSANIHLYDADKNLIASDNLLSSEEIDSREVISALLSVGPSVGNYGEVANRLARTMAEDYVAKFYPSKEAILDIYYCYKDLEGMEALYVSGNLTEAEAILLEKLENTNDKKLEKKIAQNLYIIYDIRGDFEKRDYWKEKSF